VTGDEADVAQVAGGHAFAHVLMERVEPDVEVHGIDEAARPGLVDQPRGLGRGHRERLLADDVLACGEDRRRLRDMEVVRRGDVDDVDRVVREDLVQAGIAVANVQGVGSGGGAFRRAAEDAAHVDPDAAELLDVDGPDEAGADDRGADVREPAQSRSLGAMAARRRPNRLV
jgi:hypothetical protein